MSPVYSENSSMREARASYFADNGFGPDGGYTARWVQFEMGPVAFAIPNTASRVRAVRYHDLHHILTGYTTDFHGEFEISAWEIGAGCRDFYAAWLLNLAGMAVGAFTMPRRTFRAFMRGRREKSLYGRPLDSLLGQRVGQVREQVAKVQRPLTAVSILGYLAAVGVGISAAMVLAAVGLTAAPLMAWMSRMADGAPAEAGTGGPRAGSDQESLGASHVAHDR